MSRTLDLLELPWMFTQRGAETTETLRRELDRRGVHTDADQLDQLHRSRTLVPLLEIIEDPARRAAAPWNEPRSFNSRLREMRAAQTEGRVRDPADDDVGIRFDGRKISDPQGWWNGLLYSQWQLLDIETIRAALNGTVQPSTQAGDLQRLTEARDWAVTLSVLEARYLPLVEGDWLLLRGDTDNEWESYRDSFDPVAALAALGLQADKVAKHAETLLFRAHRLDPLGTWSDLIRRAPRSKWETLRNDVLCAMELRVAAEVLLLFYEDLVDHSAAVPLRTPQGRPMGWHHTYERLSYQPHDLDTALGSHGLSPHPRAVVMVEGETEEVHFRRTLEHLDLNRRPHLVRVVCLRGADKPLALPAAATVAPILGQRRPDGYDLTRPPCHLLVAVDADKRWDTTKKAENERQKIVAEIREVVLRQAPDADVAFLDEMVEVHTWRDGCCFELEHFTDDELMAGLAASHPAPSQRPAEGVIRQRLLRARRLKQDIRTVYYDWKPQPSKVDLAVALWPTLQHQIDDARHGNHPMPQIAQIAIDAYFSAQRYARGTYSIGIV